MLPRGARRETVGKITQLLISLSSTNEAEDIPARGEHDGAPAIHCANWNSLMEQKYIEATERCKG